MPIGAIIVTYQPNLAQLHHLLQILQQVVDVTVVVNNGALNSHYQQFMVTAQHPQQYFLQMPSNIGIGGALNRGMDQLVAQGCRYAWTFDQDSCPAPDCLPLLWAAWQAAGPEPFAAVVPAIHDRITQKTLPYLIEQPQGGVAATSIERTQPVAAAITSGMLVDIAVWQNSGGARADWFIDHIDTEWCFRVRSLGYGILAVPAAVLEHELGQTRQRFFNATQTIKVRSPLRTYYMLRNGWALSRLSHTPRGWRSYFLRQALRIMLVAIVYGPLRWQQLLAMCRAWQHCHQMDD